MSLSLRLGEFLEKNNVAYEDLEQVLAKYRLEPLLPNILRFLQKRKSLDEKRNKLVIETPYPLDKDALIKIKKIAGSESDGEVIINETLLAGFRATHKDKLYDGSAKRIIDQFTR